MRRYQYPRKNYGIRIPRRPLPKFNFHPLISDVDHDGVPNKQDCRPFDPRLQHISKTMKKRIKKLPIFASPTSISEEKRRMFERSIPEIEKIKKDDPYGTEKVASLMKSRQLPHIMSKEAKQTAPEARRLFFTTVKDYPGVISEIERTEPKKVIIAAERQPKEESQKGWTAPTEEVYIGPQTPYYSKAHRKKLAKTTYHELKHVEQLKKKPIKEVLEEIDKPFEERPMEIEAIEHSEQKMKEYHKGRRPTGKAISKILELEDEE